jgi:hypothetical protein
MIPERRFDASHACLEAAYPHLQSQISRLLQQSVSYYNKIFLSAFWLHYTELEADDVLKTSKQFLSERRTFDLVT